MVVSHRTQVLRSSGRTVMLLTTEPSLQALCKFHIVGKWWRWKCKRSLLKTPVVSFPLDLEISHNFSLFMNEGLEYLVFPPPGQFPPLSPFYQYHSCILFLYIICYSVTSALSPKVNIS